MKRKHSVDYSYESKEIAKNRERLIVYNENKEPIAFISKERLHDLDKIKLKEGVSPWIECVICFVVDPKDKKVAVQFRRDYENGLGKLDICSGIAKDGEINKTAMMRGLREEMQMKNYENLQIADKLAFLGNLKSKFSDNEDSKESNLHCFTAVYAFLVDDKKSINPNEESIQKIKWINLEDVKNAIRTSMFRFAYTEDNKALFEKIFENLDSLIENRKHMGEEEYLRDWE